MKNPILYLLCGVWALHGCSLAPIKLDPGSVRIEKKANIHLHIGKDNNIDWINSWSDDDFIIIDILSNENLIELSKKHSRLIATNTYFCDTPKSLAPIDPGTLYTHGQSLGFHAFNSDPLVPVDGVYRYELVMFISFEKDKELGRESPDKNQTHYQKFNLRENPQDVCINVVAVGFMTPTYTSNTIRLKKEDIVKAINGQDDRTP
jgi:hypothetical protein